MKVAVCIKQVPDTTEVKIDPETNTLVRQGVPSIVNPFDMYALEEGIRIREKLGGTVTAITMGPPQAKAALETAIAMGCDDAVLLSDRAFAGADTLSTSYTLGRTLEKLGPFDLILCGKQAIDGDTAQVGPGVAEQLDIPHMTYIRKVVELGDGKIRVERMVEGGYEVIECDLPVLLTVVKDINEPRLPSLKGIMRAKRAEIPVWGAADIAADDQKIGLVGSPTEVVRIFTPEIRSRGEFITGEPAEQAHSLIGKLREARLI